MQRPGLPIGHPRTGDNLKGQNAFESSDGGRTRQELSSGPKEGRIAGSGDKKLPALVWGRICACNDGSIVLRRSPKVQADEYYGIWGADFQGARIECQGGVLTWDEYNGGRQGMGLLPPSTIDRYAGRSENNLVLSRRE